MRKRVIEIKRVRRVSVGPQVTIVFENRATMIFQIEEMCRAESISTPDKIQEEIDIYNKILPDAGQLGATLLVEITDEAQIATTLERLVGLQEHVWLVVGGERIKAEFDPDQFQADKLAAVQYLKFTLSPDGAEGAGDGGHRGGAGDRSSELSPRSAPRRAVARVARARPSSSATRAPACGAGSRGSGGACAADAARLA